MKSMGRQEDKLTFSDEENTVTIKLYFALMRKKENPGVTKPLVMRQIIRNTDIDFAVLMTRIRNVPGVWRIYETLNARRLGKARDELVIELIKDKVGKYNNRVDSLWKTCLMQPHNKAESFILLDIDSQDPDLIAQITHILDDAHAVYEIRPTVSGYHIKTTRFDTRTMKPFEKVEIKHDALFFMQIVDTRAPTQ